MVTHFHPLQRSKHMHIEVKSGNILEAEADLLIVNLFEGVTRPGGATGAVDSALDGHIRQLIALGDCSGKLGDTTLLYTLGKLPAPRVLVVGLGEASEFDGLRARVAAAKAIRAAKQAKARRVATIAHGAGIGGMHPIEAGQALVEGSLLESYEMPAARSGGEDSSRVETLTLVEFNGDNIPLLEAGVQVGRIIAESAMFARDLAATPSNIATPTYVANEAAAMAEETGLDIRIMEWDEMEALGMNILLAVAKGSDEPPKFVILEHNQARAEELPTIVLVGKGVTFDTGGYSLKRTEGMWKMKYDMSGAANVLGILRAAALLDLPLHVVGLTPLVENMINGHAQKPGDVYKGMTGKTMEVISTDAEGRMILADALAYAGRFNPDAVIDQATLTGAISVALGEQAAGLFTEEEGVKARLLAAAEATGERLWPMPMYDEYNEYIKSDFADVKNSTSPDRFAGVSTSAKFLQHFTEDYPWAHLDIANMSWTNKARPMYPKGAAAFGVRLLVQMLRDWQ
ncbi:MAG TPA: leucyl aminopeptidase [Caldilineales bacterium]|nr:leucyl aminopeptidase [Caldilineales bacterium]